MKRAIYTAPASREEPSLRLRYALVFGVAAGVLAADQVVKAIVSATLGGGRYIDLLGGVVRLDYTRNTGAAFGVYQGGGAVFALIAVGVCAAIVFSYRRIGRSPVTVRLAIGLILGGAMGNLVDRIRLGYVVDFIDLRWWPVFNLADSAIVIGVVLLVLHSLTRPDRQSHT